MIRAKPCNRSEIEVKRDRAVDKNLLKTERQEAGWKPALTKGASPWIVAGKALRDGRQGV